MEPLDILARVRSWEVGDPPCTDDQGAVAGRFAWDAYHPLAVRLVLIATDGTRDEVSWTFARDLLRDGCGEPAGYGDVAVWPDGTNLSVRLTSPDGTCVLTIRNSVARVRLWVNRTYVAIPAGAEDYEARADKVLTAARLRYAPDEACKRNACERCHQWEANR